MATQTIEEFFTAKILVIPAYQRDYAWTTGNIDDLFEELTQRLAAQNSNANPAFSKDAILARSAELARFSVKKWPLTEADLAE